MGGGGGDDRPREEGVHPTLFLPVPTWGPVRWQKRGRGHLGRIGVVIWRAAADSPSRDGAVFVLRVCKLAVIRLLSSDVGELIRPVLMAALISLWCVLLMRA